MTYTTSFISKSSQSVQSSCVCELVQCKTIHWDTGRNGNTYTHINCSYNKLYATSFINKYIKVLIVTTTTCLICDTPSVYGWRVTSRRSRALIGGGARLESVYHQSSELELHVLARATAEGGSSWSKIQIYLSVFTTALIKALTTAVEALSVPTLNHWNRSVAFKWRFFVSFWTKERAKDSGQACWVQLHLR